MKYIDKCWQKRHESAANNFGRYPDYILIHPKPFDELLKEILPENSMRIFGNDIDKMWNMKVIITTAIDELEPICLFSSFRNT